MTPTDLLAVFSGLSLLVSIITILHSVISARSKASKTEIDTIHERMNQLSNRLTAAEEQIKHLPSAAAIAGLTTQLSELHGDFREMLGEFKALKNQVGNIDDFLRKQS